MCYIQYPMCFFDTYMIGINTNKRSFVCAFPNRIRWVSKTSHPSIYMYSPTLYKVDTFDIYKNKEEKLRL